MEITLKVHHGNARQVYRFLQAVYCEGKAFAAYLFLPCRANDRSARTERFSEVLIIDYAADGRVIGIEIVHPQSVTIEELNQALAHIGQPPLQQDELSPLRAA